LTIKQNYQLSTINYQLSITHFVRNEGWFTGDGVATYVLKVSRTFHHKCVRKYAQKPQ